ncbi:UNVERIFIED_CONTAM: hypothetical protein GTU68_031251 [Idotea baltica]|nr:hypothetical protein [Idotea baltica]
MQTNTFLQAIKKREPQVGLWVCLCSNFAADVVATAGYDWALLDMEHSPNELGIVMSQMQAFQAGTTSCVSRPMWNDSILVKRLMDIGSQSLLFPMIQSAAEAQSAVSATRYPPEGIRGVSGTQRGNQFGRVKDYFEKVHSETCVIVQIETMHALDQVEEIAKVDGVDGVFFGPADLAADMGKLGQVTDEQLWEHIVNGAKRVEAVGKPAGTLVFDPAKASALLNDDFTFIACGSDLGLLARGADNLLADVRKDIR